MSNNKGFKRTDRIEQLIQRELAKVIQQEIKPPIFVTVSHIVVSKDLSHAKVYFTVFGSEKKEVQNLLNDAAIRYRGLLAKSLNLRKMPELNFHYDTSVEYSNRLNKLIDAAVTPRHPEPEQSKSSRHPEPEQSEGEGPPE